MTVKRFCRHTEGHLVWEAPLPDVYELMTDAVLVIREDESLRDCFNRILQIGPCTQQVRVALLESELSKLGAPQEVMTFVRLLSNDQLAHRILTEINA